MLNITIEKKFILTINETRIELSEKRIKTLISELENARETYNNWIYKEFDNWDPSPGVEHTAEPRFALSILPNMKLNGDEIAELRAEIQENVLGWEGAVAQLHDVRESIDRAFES